MKIIFNIRTIFGFVVAPLVPGMLVALLAVIDGRWPMARWYIEFGALAGYPAMIVVGIPLHIFLVRRGSTGLSLYAASGALMGLLVYLMAFIPALVTGQFEPILYAMKSTLAFLPISAICGAIAGTAFWLLAVMGTKSRRMS